MNVEIHFSPASVPWLAFGHPWSDASSLFFNGLPVSCPVNSLNYDEPRAVKNKARSAGNVGTLARDATPLLAILGHLKGASHGPRAGVAVLGKGVTIPSGPRLATEPVERVITQRINGAGH